MALARVTTWSGGQVLTASALNGEFNNILNNPMSLISPLTADLDFGGFKLTALSAGTVSAPSLYFTGDSNTGFYRAGADIFAITSGGVDVARFQTIASGVNYWDLTPGATGTPGIIDLAAAGSDSNVTARISSKGTGDVVLRGGSTAMLTVTGTTSVNMGTNKPFIPAAVSGNPTAHALYQENVPKGWAHITMSGGTPTLGDSFNVNSITDNGVGDITVTWETDFANATYAVGGHVKNGGTDRNVLTIHSTTGLAAGSARFFVIKPSTENGSDDFPLMTVVALGDQ